MLKSVKDVLNSSLDPGSEERSAVALAEAVVASPFVLSATQPVPDDVRLRVLALAAVVACYSGGGPQVDERGGIVVWRGDATGLGETEIRLMLKIDMYPYVICMLNDGSDEHFAQAILEEAVVGARDEMRPGPGEHMDGRRFIAVMRGLVELLDAWVGWLEHPVIDYGPLRKRVAQLREVVGVWDVMSS